MTAPSNLTGQRFGRLTVIRRHPQNAKDGQARWECECDCSNGKIVTGGNLKGGGTTSCGCFATENKRERSVTHGLHKSSEYRVWQGIKKRCYNPTHTYYHNYGGRGITMCDEWKNSFEAFYRDMGPRPSLEHTIDRRESNKGYYKDNCKWATRIEQGNNTRRNVYYEFDGERKTLASWCRELNINYKAMHHLLTNKMDFEDAANKLIKEGKTFQERNNMKKLILIEGTSPDGLPIEPVTEIDSVDLPFVDELEKIVKVFKENGYEIDILTAYNAHCARDNDYMASWLDLPDEKDIVKCFLPYLVEVKG